MAPLRSSTKRKSESEDFKSIFFSHSSLSLSSLSLCSSLSARRADPSRRWEQRPPSLPPLAISANRQGEKEIAEQRRETRILFRLFLLKSTPSSTSSSSSFVASNRASRTNSPLLLHLPHPTARTWRERLKMAKKKAENSKATVAKAAKEERAVAKGRASEKAAEDAYWEAAGDGAKSKNAAKKEQQVRMFLSFSTPGDVERCQRMRAD